MIKNICLDVSGAPVSMDCIGMLHVNFKYQQILNPFTIDSQWILKKMKSTKSKEHVHELRSFHKTTIFLAPQPIRFHSKMKNIIYQVGIYGNLIHSIILSQTHVYLKNPYIIQ